MAECPWPQARAGLRSAAAHRRHRSTVRAVGLAGLAAILPLAAVALFPPAPRLVWNASASTPRGLYWVDASGPVSTGDLVVARLPRRFRPLAADRGYLPAGVPLVKRVAATSGARICRRGSAIAIDGMRAVVGKPHDGMGRALPRWAGCTTLPAGDVFLLGDDPASFDGRYFGATSGADVVGRAVLLWRA